MVVGVPSPIGLRTDSKGRTTITGVRETRAKFLEMADDRNLFDKWMKEAAMVAAREAVKLAPVQTGALASSIKGWASKTLTIQSRTGGTPQKRFAYGGIITSGTPSRVQYGRKVSYGAYHQAGTMSKTGNRKWRTTVRGPGNAFMVKARENKKSYMVTMLNYKLAAYFKQKGFQTNGIG